MKFFQNLLRDEAGATAIEYGLIAALIAVAAITAMQGLGSQLSNTFENVCGKMKDGSSTNCRRCRSMRCWNSATSACASTVAGRNKPPPDALPSAHPAWSNVPWPATPPPSSQF
jgi:pilus assembly protein Flp/PilA